MKRMVDVVVALLGLVVFSPVIAAVALVIRLTMGRPVLFRQVRPGFKTRPFTMYKFRTMREAYGPDGTPLLDAERLTPLGRLLRKTSLDELPQLWNVLRGDLSLVGPRPLLTRYLPYFTERELVRHEVRPGITGWAQIHGRNASSWDRRLADDVWYVEHQSLWLDFRILVATARIALLGRGVVVDPESTMRNLDVERADRMNPATSRQPLS